MEGRISKNLFKEFSKTDSRILGATSQLHKFFLNPLLRGHSVSVPETSQNAPNINQRTKEDDSQGDPHPEASVSQSQTTHFLAQMTPVTSAVE